MPIGTCDPATRGESSNQTVLSYGNPDGTGAVEIDIRWGWDGVSTRETGCDGPILSIRTRNTSQSTAWALLPSKKRGNPWVQIDPGTDVTTTSKGTLSNLGVSNRSDADSVGMVFQDPALFPPNMAALKG